jgi:beta-lactamase regulating signal transducer with metallopeptidase domain
MMHVLIEIALKSVLIAGLTLGLLQLMKSRSAAERSWVAHIGLLALLIMAFAPLVMPSWNVEAPALLGQAPAVEAPAQAVLPSTAASPVVRATSAPSTAAPASALSSISPVAATSALYAIPAVILLFLTFVALARLVALRARADVLVDGHWLSALARAQRRMGFKHGTALLTSDDLASPISWGLMRPVILLNSRAVEAADEAEAIIAHELAHVARMDWAKLLLARIATALFWFNPLVWMLAREAHQLREEAADDSVLAADIDDTDYAQLLVGVARHECPGLLLGAHGVAPSKSSLARRVARVLDGKSVRGPVARSFGLGVFVGAALVAAPLAALTLSPKQPAAGKETLAADKAAGSKPYYVPSEPPADLPHIIAQGVSTSVSTAAAAVARQDVAVDVDPDDIAEAQRDAAHDMAIEQAKAAAERTRETGQTVAEEIRKSHRNVEQTLGITPEYIGAMRSAAPQFARLEPSEFAGMKAVGVTPEFARALVSAGFPAISAEDLAAARAVGLTGDYVRQLRSAGVRGDLDDFVSLRAMGIDPSFVQRARRAGYNSMSADELIELKALGTIANPRTPAPPGGWGNSAPPSRTGRPAASPPNWKPDPDG